MTLFREQFRVQSSRHPHWDYSLPGWYFVTICTAKRQCFFASVVDFEIKLTDIGTAAERLWHAIPSFHPNVATDAFVAMPNHLHGIIVIEGEHRYTPSQAVPQRPRKNALRPHSLGSIVGSYKAGVTRWCNQAGHSQFGWQPRFYDHLIRGNAALRAVRDYIAANPLNWLEDEFYVS